MTPNKQHKRESFLHFIFRVIMILIGAGSAAVSIELFLSLIILSTEALSVFH